MRTTADAGPRLTGEAAGRYRDFVLLGDGGMSQVWQCFDEHMQRTVSPKVVHPEATDVYGTRRRIERAGRSLARLHHPNVVEIYDVFFDEGCGVVIVMQVIEGQSLARVLKFGWLGHERATAITADVADAVAALHERHLLHRDIKPANIMLRPDDTPVLMDFGLAKRFGTEEWTRLTETRQVVGTPAFIPPEMWRNEPVGQPGDIFQLGVVLYRLLTNRMPLPDADIETLYGYACERREHRVTAPHELVPGIDRGLSDFVIRMLDQNPARRPPSARAVARALRRNEFSSDALRLTQAVSAVGPSVSSRRSLLALAALPVVAAAAFLTLQRNPTGGPAAAATLRPGPCSLSATVTVPTARELVLNVIDRRSRSIVASIHRPAATTHAVEFGSLDPETEYTFIVRRGRTTDEYPFATTPVRLASGPLVTAYRGVCSASFRLTPPTPATLTIDGSEASGTSPLVVTGLSPARSAYRWTLSVGRQRLASGTVPSFPHRVNDDHWRKQPSSFGFYLCSDPLWVGQRAVYVDGYGAITCWAVDTTVSGRLVEAWRFVPQDLCTSDVDASISGLAALPDGNLAFLVRTVEGGGFGTLNDIQGSGPPREAVERTPLPEGWEPTRGGGLIANGVYRAPVRSRYGFGLAACPLAHRRFDVTRLIPTRPSRTEYYATGAPAVVESSVWQLFRTPQEKHTVLTSWFLFRSFDGADRASEFLEMPSISRETPLMPDHENNLWLMVPTERRTELWRCPPTGPPARWLVPRFEQEARPGPPVVRLGDDVYFVMEDPRNEGGLSGLIQSSVATRLDLYRASATTGAVVRLDPAAVTEVTTVYNGIEGLRVWNDMIVGFLRHGLFVFDTKRQRLGTMVFPAEALRSFVFNAEGIGLGLTEDGGLYLVTTPTLMADAVPVTTTKVGVLEPVTTAPSDR